MIRRLQALALSIGVLGGALAAQSRSPAPPEQSPRKALLEMLLGGDGAIKKHLTLDVQHKLGELLNSSTPGGMNPIQALSMARAAGGDNLETYEAGPVLFSYANPTEHRRLVVRLDGDDVHGSEDQMRLSLHSFRDGVEEELPVVLRFTLSWKAQQSVWRLNAITLRATLPIGDPRLFDKSRWALAGVSPAGKVPATRLTLDSEVSTRTAPAPTVVGPSVRQAAAAPETEPPVNEPTADSGSAHSSSSAAASDTPQMTPARAVRLIGLAEDIYAKKHPETGFTCFLSELVNVGRGFEDGEPYRFIDPEFEHSLYNGYRFSLTGCAGSPVKSYQVSAEPVSGAGRAYCSDPTHQLRGSDNGSSASCLASGKTVQR
ncbi:MAG TPA: hypothetical protein VIX19_02810 [Terriglobales bacterium]